MKETVVGFGGEICTCSARGNGTLAETEERDSCTKEGGKTLLEWSLNRVGSAAVLRMNSALLGAGSGLSERELINWRRASELC